MVLLRLIRAFFGLLFWPLRRLREFMGLPQGSFVELTVDGAVVDVVPRRRRLISWMQKRTMTVMSEVVELTQQLETDTRVRGLIVTIKSPVWGVAHAAALYDALKRLRDAGKEVVVFLPTGVDSKGTWAAMAASKILLGPEATIAPVGFQVKGHYAGEALRRVGLQAEVYAKGRYKSAGERLTRDEMSDAEHEQLSRIVDSFYEGLVAAIAEGRKRDVAWAQKVVDEAPFRGEAALAEGLIDGVAYDDEMLDRLAVGGERPRTIDGNVYLAFARARKFSPISRPSIVAIIPVHGAIMSQSPVMFGGAIDEPIIGMIRAARANKNIKGVLLHVDSPGGSALASDRIHHELEALAKEKPLVACMGNVAASGGYYVAAPAHAIVALPTTITGSIGVVGTRFVIEPLLSRLGITSEGIRRGAHAGLLDAGAPLNEEERKVIDKELDGVYKSFLAVVARGRKMPVERVAELAEGRVWTGADAKANGLVDILGGMDVAVAELGKRVGGTAFPFVMSPARHSLPPLDPPRAAAALLSQIGLSSLASSVETLGSIVGTKERVMLLGPVTSVDG